MATAHIDPPSTFEDMTPVVTIPLAMGLWAGFLIAGPWWALWQRSIAVAAIPWGVRDPDWHAYAWFSPIVMWWEPVRNVHQLSTYLLPGEQRWLVPAWWAPWVAFRLSHRLARDVGSCGCRHGYCSIPDRRDCCSCRYGHRHDTRRHPHPPVDVRRPGEGPMPYVMDFVKRPFPLSLPSCSWSGSAPRRHSHRGGDRELVTLMAESLLLTKAPRHSDPLPPTPAGTSVPVHRRRVG